MSLIFNNYGKIFSVKDAIVNVLGLNMVTSGEMVKDFSGNSGLVLNLGDKWTGVVMFDDNISKSGDQLNRTFKTLNISVDLSCMGNVYDSIGRQLNKKNHCFNVDVTNVFNSFGLLKRNVEIKAPGIIVREPVYETVFTGIPAVDAIFPIGQGQRELIIGDRQTGKTQIALDVFLNQSYIDNILLKTVIKSDNNE